MNYKNCSSNKIYEISRNSCFNLAVFLLIASGNAKEGFFRYLFTQEDTLLHLL